MQDEPTPTLPPRTEEKSPSMLLVALFTAIGIICILLVMEYGMSTIENKRDAPLMTFTSEDTHLHFHYFSNPRRRALKTVESVEQIPREHRRMVMVTERGEKPMQTGHVYIANLLERFPSGTIRAHRLEIGQVLFALDMQGQAHKEAMNQQRQLPAPTPIGAAPIDSYRREMNQIDTSKLDQMDLPVNLPDPGKLQKCSAFQGQPDQMTRCMNGR